MYPPLLRARTSGDPDFVGPYRVRARLGGGGFGTVYAASGPGGELVAVKTVHRQLLEEDDFRDRFGREIRAMERVESKYVPALLDGRATDDQPWLATELVPGISLEKVVGWCGRLPENAVWQLAAGMAEGLAAVHAAGLFHRDLKPHNVLLTLDRPWIIDFGLVRLSELPNHASSRIAMATCEYAPPEQLKNGLRAAGTPADIFAFGATLLFAATGHAPHEADTEPELYFRALTRDPNVDGLPPGLSGLVEPCLIREATARPALDQVRTLIARRIGASAGDDFGAALPGDVVGLLEDFRAELAGIMQASGSARLGWGSPLGSDSEIDPSMLPPVEDLDTMVPFPATRVEPPAATTPDDTDGLAATEPMPQPLSVWGRVAARRRPRESGEETAQDQDRAASEAWRHEPVLTRGGRLARDPQGHGWTRYFSSWICSPVAVHANTCVVTCRDGTVWGLWAQDGRDRWRADLGGPVSCAPVILPDGARGEGTAFAAGPDGRLHAFDLATGEARVVLPPGAAIEGTPVLVRGPASVLYVIRSDGELYAIDARTESARLVRRLDGGATGALAATAQVIAAADAKGTVQLIDPATGQRRRLLRTDGLVLGAPVLTAGRVFAAGTDGKLRWADIMGEEEGEVVGFGAAPVHAAPVSGGGRLYVGCSDGRVHAWDLRERDKRGLMPSWPSRALGAEVVGLAANEEKLYAAAGNRVFEIDPRGEKEAAAVIVMNCLIGAAPVIFGRSVYAVGLGGVVGRAAMR
jgi:outer membrane protein assembly factor BamB